MAGRPGIIKTLLQAGHGPKPQRGQKVTVECTGVVKATDKKFWSTKDPGQQNFSFNIGLGQVIKGWDEGVLDMQLGEEAVLDCRSDYAYGAGGFPAWGIPPSAELLFTIKVVAIN